MNMVVDVSPKVNNQAIIMSLIKRLKGNPVQVL